MYDAITPYVVSRPPWLVGSSPLPPVLSLAGQHSPLGSTFSVGGFVLQEMAVAWSDRKLIFLAGRTPQPSSPSPQQPHFTPPR